MSERYLTVARFVELYRRRWPNRSCVKSTVQRACRNGEFDALGVIYIERNDAGESNTYAIPYSAVSEWEPRPMGRPPKA